MKIQVNVMNVKDHEEQEDMQISEKEDDTACNIYLTLQKTYTKKETWLIFDTCEIIMYVPNMYQQAQIQTTTLTGSNVQHNIQRYAFIYVNTVHMGVGDAVVSQKHHLCSYIFDSS